MILLLVGVSKGFAQVPSYVPSNGLVAWWPFTGNAKDSSGNGNDGTVSGASLTTDRFGKSNSAYSFDGGNDYISVPYSSTLGIQKYFSSSVWIYMDGGSCNPRVYEIHENLNCGGYTMAFNGASSGSRTFHTGGFGNCTTGIGITGSISAVSTHSWHHVAVVIDGVNAIGKLYIDGNLTYTSTGNMIPIINYYGAALCIGNIAPNRCDWWGGKIDDFGLWNRPLSACEIAGLYQSKVVTPKPATVSIGSDTQRYCGKDSVKITATSGFKSYVWNNGKTGGSIYAKTSGIYIVTATDSQGCAVNDNAVLSILNPRISPRDTVVCFPNSGVLNVIENGGNNPCGKPQGTLGTGLVGYWPFCGNANDISGNGNNGSVNGASLAMDRVGRTNSAYYFDGINDFIETKNGGPSGTGISVSYWFKSNQNKQYVDIIAFGGSSSGSKFEVLHNYWAAGGGPCVGPSIHGGFTLFAPNNSSNPHDNIWHHAVVVLPSGATSLDQTKFYIDGKLLSGTCSYANYGAPAPNIGVGSKIQFGKIHTSMGSTLFNGWLDEIGIWSRALTQQEITSLYTTQFAKTSWSTNDTTQNITISNIGKNNIWVKTSDGIGTCYDTTTVRIQRPIVNIGKDTQRYCGADSVKLAASSGFASYSWSNGKKGASAYVNATGAIQVTATDSLGCSARDTTLISILNPRITPRDTIVCSGQAVTLRIKDTSTAAPACATLPASLKTGLVGWWPFCGNANDESGNGNHGKVNGATLVKDRFGNLNRAYSFQKSNSNYIQGNLGLKGNTFTVSVWAKHNNGVTGPNPPLHNDWIISFGSQKPINVLELGAYAGGSSISYGKYNDVLFATNARIRNNWTNYIITYSGGNSSIFENGILIESNSGSSIIIDSTSSFYFGRQWDPFLEFWDGLIDDIGIWNRVLTQQEISAVYNLKNVQLTSSWSTGDTLSNTIIKTAGTTPVWLRQSNGIGTCYDTVTVGISNPKVDFAADTLRLQNCGRDSMKVSVGKGWKSVAWSNGATDSSTSLKTTGMYTVKVQDNVGCYAYDTTYFVNPGKVKVTVLLVDSVNCYNGSDGSISTTQTGGFTPVSLSWNDPAKQSTSKATGLKAGSYKLIATDAYGCKDSVTAAVQQPAKLTVTLSSIDSVRCYRFTDGSLTVTATGGTVPYNYGWNTGAKTTKIDNLGSGVYKVVVQDGNGCKDSLTASLQDPPELIARIVSGTMAMKSEKLAVSAVASPAGAHAYSWQPISLFGSMASSQNASITVEKNVTLRLTVTNKKGCIAKDSLDVTVVQALKDIMPNAFSPNTDGLNEGFGLPDIFEISEFYVYDRWGGIIFTGSESTPRWNGLIGTEAAPAGSYSYHIVARLKGGIQEFQYSGKVALIK